EKGFMVMLVLREATDAETITTGLLAGSSGRLDGFATGRDFTIRALSEGRGAHDGRPAEPPRHDSAQGHAFPPGITSCASGGDAGNVRKTRRPAVCSSGPLRTC